MIHICRENKKLYLNRLFRIVSYFKTFLLKSKTLFLKIQNIILSSSIKHCETLTFDSGSIGNPSQPLRLFSFPIFLIPFPPKCCHTLKIKACWGYDDKALYFFQVPSGVCALYPVCDGHRPHHLHLHQAQEARDQEERDAHCQEKVGHTLCYKEQVGNHENLLQFTRKKVFLDLKNSFFPICYPKMIFLYVSWADG